MTNNVTDSRGPTDVKHPWQQDQYEKTLRRLRIAFLSCTGVDESALGYLDVKRVSRPLTGTGSDYRYGHLEGAAAINVKITIKRAFIAMKCPIVLSIVTWDHCLPCSFR